MIPKIIHYCWFGGNPLPELAKNCIASWKKYCPDYEIIEWNESNFDFSDCQYACDAYEAKKYAFVSDYARFKILYENGGLYFDTDVELLKSIDCITEKGCFLGCEPSKENYLINTGLGLGFEKNNSICKKILLSFTESEFDKNNVMNNETVVIRVTDIMKKYGFNSIYSDIQTVSGITIYPPEYFCPKCFETGKIELTNNTVSIHHYDASWFTDEDKYIKKIRYRLSNNFPKKIAHWLSLIIGFTKYRGFFKMPKAMVNFKINNIKNK